MLLKTFITFFCVHSTFFLISHWPRSNGSFKTSCIIVFVPLIFLSIYWPVYLRTILNVTINIKSIVGSFFSGLFAIILSNIFSFFIWYLYTHKDGVQGLWHKDIEIARLLLYVHLVIYIVFYFPSILFNKRKA